MKNLGIKLSLFINYFVFAILLNSVGAVILQVQRNFGVNEAGASVLEGFKDIPIAVASFLLASLLPKLGLKKAMLIGLGIVSLACFMATMANGFWAFKLLFVCIGVSFALIKVSTFATIGLVTEDAKSHASFMSLIEGFFMVGILAGNVLLSLFVDDLNPTSTEWLRVYWILGGLSLFALLVLLVTPLDDSAAKIEERPLSEDFVDMLKLIALPLVIVFIASIFMYVLIEQSFQTWTPTFYQDVLHVPASMSIQAGAILAGAAALGRMLASGILKRVNWYYVVSACIVLCAIMVLISLPLAGKAQVSDMTGWRNAPLAAYIFPIMGLFLSPVYPAINSVMLSTLPKHRHSAMSGLIVVFSALGGTTGSIITGNLFHYYSPQTAFYLSLVPMGLILLALWLFRNQTLRSNVSSQLQDKRQNIGKD